MEKRTDKQLIESAKKILVPGVKNLKVEIKSGIDDQGFSFNFKAVTFIQTDGKPGFIGSQFL